MRGIACVATAGLGIGPAAAETTAFDLAGPVLRISVTHGGETLPLSQVPNLSAGDRLRIAAELPAGQGARYRLVLAFLRGATNPPPKNWLVSAETWKPKKATIDAVVPQGAGQAVVLMVPETGGALDAVGSAIRSRPGAFVRASQELNQAMLDRARLETFVDRVTRRDPAALSAVSPQLARSLAVKLDTDCLLRQPDARVACLTQGSNAAVLADGQTSSIAQTLAGAPADIALQLSSTPQAGFGYYSPYVGVIRDVARIFGAFQSAQLQFIPALGVQHGPTTALLLNTVPSFRKPQSVLVAALPSVAPPALPPLSAGDESALCATQPGLVLPVSGAPLVFATDYARQMAVRLTGSGGRVMEIPATADPARGGYVLGAADATAFGPGTQATLHGLWGFQPFDGPTFRLVAPAGRSWRAAGDATLVVGRETPLRLTGAAAACVTTVAMERGTGPVQGVAWRADGADALALKVPLAGAGPGDVTIVVSSQGATEPQRIRIRAFAEASRIASFDLRAGDRGGVLTGTRLDQVAALDIDGVEFRPGPLERSGATDRLPMTTDMAAVGALQPGQSREARVTLNDGRVVPLKMTVAPARPAATLVGKTVERIGPAPALPLALSGDELVPADARLTFSLRAEGATRLTAGTVVEVTAGESLPVVALPLRLQDPRVGIAAFVPSVTLGDSAHGPLRFRLVQNGVAGDWQPLATLVRLPTLTALRCPPAGGRCMLAGDGLFLVRSVSDGTDAPATAIPDGFTGGTIEVPRPASGRLAVSLRDAPEAPVSLAVAP
ncbi:hypothetical protein FSB78_06190 [Sphingomonas ginsenosidivorax]|uniref:Uncharacterized protein n=2 Tax=Sphingomonas ginsenosidivorax TaxID=862135 RepID=A0A5C6UIZ9_9SPHN|nr:hypothetical protein FSB78_06190 [Sphingomonas ginsenosidivorax]